VSHGGGVILPQYRVLSYVFRPDDVVLPIFVNPGMASFMRIKATVRRYVASISHLHRAAGLANPCNDELVPRLGANPRRTGIVCRPYTLRPGL